jgi:hypothetical protein
MISDPASSSNSESEEDENEILPVRTHNTAEFKIDLNLHIDDKAKKWKQHNQKKFSERKKFGVVQN